MRNCKNRILCLLLCSMILSTLMPISVIASELKVSEGIAASVSGVEEEVPPHDEAEPEPEPSEDLPPLIEGEEEVPPDDEAEPESEPSEDLPPLAEGEEGVSPDEAGAETVEDMTLLMAATAPAVTGGALLADWTYTEQGNRIILDKYIGKSLNVIIPGAFDEKSGKSVVINTSASGFLPENTETLKIGDERNKVTLTGVYLRWLPKKMVEADLSGLRPRGVVIRDAFRDMTRLERIDVTGWDVSNERVFMSAFRGCRSLTSIDLSSWNVSSGTAFMNMFEGCTSLTSIDLSSWNVSSATHFQGMFKDCTSLTSIDLSSWANNTINVTEMLSMFFRCTSLEQVNLSGWKLPKLTSVGNMFDRCEKLVELDLSSWTVGPALNSTYAMFFGAHSLETLDLSGWDVSNLKTMQNMFRDCYKLKNLDLTEWKPSPTGMLNSMFAGCKSLTELDLSEWNISNATSLHGMFLDTNNLETLKIADWDTSKVTDMSFMFYRASKLRDFEVEAWNTSSVTTMNRMFYGNAADEGMDLSGWNTSKVTNMAYMFYGGDTSTGTTSGLSSLNLSSWDTSKVTDMTDMFAFCEKLQLFDLSSFEAGSSARINGMFRASRNSAIPTFIVSKDDRIRAQYGDSIEGRAYGGPSWDANGGQLSNGSATATWADKFVFPDKNALTTTDVAVFDRYTARKTGNTFQGWFLDKAGTQEFEIDRNNPKEFDLMSDAKYANMVLYAGWAPKSPVTVTVTPGSVTVTQGKTSQFTATVEGVNNLSQEVTWSVSGETSTGTSISATGLLTVATDETAPTLTVRATSVEDTGDFGTATVTVTAALPVLLTVTFLPGANGTMNPSAYSEEVAAGGNVTTVPGIVPNPGYTFLGWKAEGDTIHSSVDILDMAIQKSMTFTAAYKQGATVTGYVKTEANRNITASLKRGDAVITTAAAIQGKFVMADVEAGVYTLELSAPAALTRRMEITVEAGINLEVATVDNPLTLIYGDANGDGIIDALDLGLIKTGFGKVKGDEGYTEYIDVNADGIVDALDLGHVKTWFGSTSGSYVI